MTEATPLNLDRLIKLLKLSASPNDSEALAAIRKANELLARSFGDWDTLLRGKVTIIEDPFNGRVEPVRAQSTRPAPPPPSRPAPAPPPKPQPAAQPFDWYNTFGGDAANPTMQKPRSKAQNHAQPAPQSKLPDQSFTKSKTGDWCVRSATALKPGQYIDIQRKKGISRVEIVAPYTVNDYGEWLYTFRDAPARPLDDLA